MVTDEEVEPWDIVTTKAEALAHLAKGGAVEVYRRGYRTVLLRPFNVTSRRFLRRVKSALYFVLWDNLQVAQEQRMAPPKEAIVKDTEVLEEETVAETIGEDKARVLMKLMIDTLKPPPEEDVDAFREARRRRLIEEAAKDEVRRPLSRETPT